MLDTPNFLLSPPEAGKEKLHISGAGPAGLAAAITYARAGGKAVVHERKKNVGTRFHDDFQGIENWTTHGNVLEELEGIGISPDFDHTPFRELVCYAPTGAEYIYRAEEPLFYLVRRGSRPGTLDHSLREQALNVGVELSFHDPVRRMPRGGIVAEGPHRSDVIATGYVFETSAADGIYTAMSDRLAPKGYAYLLVHKERGTLATCMFDDFHHDCHYLERTVDFFREKTGIQMKDPRRFGGSGNVFFAGLARKGNVLYVGESAGFQDALWGFGMRYALLSGHLAAKAWLSGHPEIYDYLWRNRLGGLLRASMVNRYFFGKLGNWGYAAFLKGIWRADDPRQWLRRRYSMSWKKSACYPLVRLAYRSRFRGGICIKEGCDCTWCRCKHACNAGSK